MHETKDSPRRWYQYSLRSLLLVLLMAGFFLGGRDQGRRQLEAEKEQTMAQQRLLEVEQRLKLARQRRIELLVAEVELARVQLELARSERRLQALAWQRLQAEDALRSAQRDDSKWINRLRSLEGKSRRKVLDSQPPRTVPVNEYWHRKEHPRRFRSA